MPPPRRRTPKLTPEVAAAIVQSIENGCTLLDSALAAGISERTLHRWLAAGRQIGEGPYWQLSQDIKRARSTAVKTASHGVFAAGAAGNWTAYAWWLERQRWRDFGRYRPDLRVLEERLRDLEKQTRTRPRPSEGPDEPPEADQPTPQPA